MRITFFIAALLLTSAFCYNQKKHFEPLDRNTARTHRVKLTQKVMSPTKRQEMIQFISSTQKRFLKDQTPISAKQHKLRELTGVHNPVLLATPDNIGKVNLYNFKNSQYTGKVSVGRKANDFDVIFDTGKGYS